jgi:peptide/nickel transport system substrate-binding protein/oligopeptide transport system substrate-binding protein
MANDSDPISESEFLELLKRRLHRRAVLSGAAAAAAGAFGAGMFRGDATAAPAARGTLSRRALQELPADAAPPEKQIFVTAGNAAVVKVIDFYEKVYERDVTADLFSEPLVRLDKNFQLQPAAAESWTGSEDGKTWTFKIRQGMVWSDGNPVTANDYVATLRYGADPEHAWDFTWYFQGVIKNWSAVVAPAEGTEALPPDQIGVRTGANEYELVIETEAAAPYLPAMLLYSQPLSKAALETHGPLYNTKPETAVSSGPFILTEWTPDQRIVYSKNEKYTGTLQVPVNQVVCKLAALDAYFTMYQNNEIDFMEAPPPAALQIMLNDPETAKEVYSGVGDFPTWHIFFDVTKAPFDNKKVRQAWSHAIDRDAIKEQILGPNGTPAYSWLAPGFPASNREGLQDIQKFDPELAKQLLSEAGFPDGAGFPKQQLWLRAPSPLDKTVAGAAAAMIKQNLGIEVELLERDNQGFMSALTAKPTEILLGYVRYGMDFFDPFNMLGVWVSPGRYAWVNADYDAKVKEAASFLGPTEERIKLFQEAERILVEDVPAVFIYHGTPVQLIKPWVKGPFLEPDENGIVAMHWPGYALTQTVPAELYIGSEAPDRA